MKYFVILLSVSLVAFCFSLLLRDVLRHREVCYGSNSKGFHRFCWKHGINSGRFLQKSCFAGDALLYILIKKPVNNGRRLSHRSYLLLCTGLMKACGVTARKWSSFFLYMHHGIIGLCFARTFFPTRSTDRYIWMEYHAELYFPGFWKQVPYFVLRYTANCGPAKYFYLAFLPMLLFPKNFRAAGWLFL